MIAQLGLVHITFGPMVGVSLFETCPGSVPAWTSAFKDDKSKL